MRRIQLFSRAGTDGAPPYSKKREQRYFCRRDHGGASLVIVEVWVNRQVYPYRTLVVCLPGDGAKKSPSMGSLISAQTLWKTATGVAAVRLRSCYCATSFGFRSTAMGWLDSWARVRASKWRWGYMRVWRSTYDSVFWPEVDLDV